jgi:hypothetical protein
MRTFEPKRGEVRGNWRKLHNGKLDNLSYSPYISRMIKRRRARWVGHVAHKREVSSANKILVPNLKRRARFGKSSAWCLLHTGFFLGLFFDPEDGGNIFLRNVG